jgi:predicted nicotinamide N-methyase
LLSSYIHGLKYGFASYAPKALSKLPELLSNPNIRVLELGAGCGIVGITLCRCYPQSSVILSDLPEAEEIATYNIARNERQAGSLQKQMNVKYQNINWEDPLPENLRTGDLDLVVVADCTYNPDVVPDLVKILADITTHNPGVLILLAMKVRHDSEIIFFDLMKEKKLEIVDKVLLPLPVLEEENQEIEIYLFEQQ